MNCSIYIHVPYCLRKCAYCDFCSYDRAELPIEDYAELLIRELLLRAETHGDCTVPTIYFGGGTPSLLPPESVAEIISIIRKNYHVADGCEITLEANPGAVTEGQFAKLLHGGVNRLSIGIQSLDDRQLALLGRLHSAHQAIDTVAHAQSAGFSNISIDLMHSLPNQTLSEWNKTLEAALNLDPQHISAYGLTIEAGTEFAAMEQRGELDLPDEELAVAMFETTITTLASAGYEHYEISNFARPGFRSGHNQVYWKRGSYLGIGAGAHSFNAGQGWGERTENLQRLHEYAQQVNCETPVNGAALTKPEAMSEFFFLGLRMLDGIDPSTFAHLFGTRVETVFPGKIDSLCKAGLLLNTKGTVRLSRKGVLLANQVMAEFI